MSVKEKLDFKGLKCPMPALLAKRALERAASGTCFEILCDDPLCGIDIPHMCRSENFAVLSLERRGETTRMVVQKP